MGITQRQVNDAVFVPRAESRHQTKQEPVRGWIRRVIAVTEDGRVIADMPDHDLLEPEPGAWAIVGRFRRNWASNWKLET